MKVAACQLPETRQDLPAALSLIDGYAQSAARAGARLVCFPECFLRSGCAAVDLGSARFARMLERLEALEPVVVIGVMERDGDSLYNSAVAISHGNVIARYRKMNLLRGEQSVFERGAESTVFDIDGTRIGLAICYDLNFDEPVARCASVGASVIACPCNNMMPRPTAEDWKDRHNAIRSRQARKHGLWIVTADVAGECADRVSYGPTAVIDARGAVVAQVPLLATGMVVADIQ